MNDDADRLPLVFISYDRRDAGSMAEVVAALQSNGYRCWVDTEDIPAGVDYELSIEQGLERAVAVVAVCTRRSRESPWLRSECAYAKDIGKLVVPLRAEQCPLPLSLYLRQAVDWYLDAERALARLLAALAAAVRDALEDAQAAAAGRPLTPAPAPDSESGDETHRLARSFKAYDVAPALPPAPDTPAAAARPAATDAAAGATRVGPPSPADLPLAAYRRSLRLEIFREADVYTALAGEARTGVAAAGGLDLHPEFALLDGRERAQAATLRHFEDVAQAVASLHRAVLVGEPGAGKTTAMMKAAHEALHAFERDPSLPLPLFVRLGRWERAGQSFAAFLAARLATDAAGLEQRLRSGAVWLLLDGLNEIPAAQRGDKLAQVAALVDAHPGLRVLASCRELDFAGDRRLDLGLDRLFVQPLDVVRIRRFLASHLERAVEGEVEDADRRRALGERRADDLLWQLAGGERAREVFGNWQRAGADQRLFFEADDIPREKPDVYGQTSVADDDYWRTVVKGPRSLLALARSPYLLALFARVYDPAAGALPANRAALFEQFVRVLLAREGLGGDGGDADRDTGERLLSALEALAWEMQSSHDDGGEVRTALPRAEARRLLPPALLARAAGTGLVEPGAEVRFAHQLLQEHFAARALARRMQDLPALKLWPAERWWRPSGWEEVAVLLAGLPEPGCEAVLEWLADASPETAARCAAESGAEVDPEALHRLAAPWLERMRDERATPEAAARAALGRALGLPLPGGMLDQRAGVGCRVDDGGWLVPDIVWVDVPAGRVALEDDAGQADVAAFRIARHPVTNSQFDAFVADAEGYGEARWWAGMTWRRDGHAPPRWREGNHPRERVSWFEAVAFCRWLTTRLHAAGDLPPSLGVRLPTEFEWQQAATAGDPRRRYPWGEAFDAAHCNTRESGMGRTTAVGIYPRGTWPGGPLDMAGNVWEWCLNGYGDPTSEGATGVDGSDEPRALRGGSWRYSDDDARCGCRNGGVPSFSGGYIGFRVCCSSPLA